MLKIIQLEKLGFAAHITFRELKFGKIFIWINFVPVELKIAWMLFKNKVKQKLRIY